MATEETQKVVFPLNKKNKFFVTLGSAMLILFLASSNAALGVLQTPILEKMDALHNFGILTTLGKMGICIMTPIGGKLGDIFGKKNVILVSATICLISMLGITFAQTFAMFAIFRLLISLAQGAYTALPYILISITNIKTDVPKYSGILASCMTFGGFSGSFLAGFLNDCGFNVLAINFSLIYLLCGMVFIFLGIKDEPKRSDQKIDTTGILSLSLFITAFVLTTNYGPKLGWANKWILLGIGTTIFAIWLLITVEKRVESKNGAPIIPISLLKNRTYAILLVIAITSNFYQAIVTNYGPMISQKLLGTSSTIAGSLTLPRTLITMMLPTFIGAWLGKNTRHYWKAIALGNALIVLAFLPLLTISKETPVGFLITGFAITGIAECFRSVSLTPSAQTMLTPETISTGTALVNFSSSFATVLATSVGGSILGATSGNLTMGIRSIFSVIVAVSLVGLTLCVVFVRPKLYSNRKAE